MSVDEPKSTPAELEAIQQQLESFRQELDVASVALVKTARLAPGLMRHLMWALLRSRRYSRMFRFLPDPPDKAVAALLMLVPEARKLFAVSRAGRQRIRAADEVARTETPDSGVGRRSSEDPS
jgi:hypothetical protein